MKDIKFAVWPDKKREHLVKGMQPEGFREPGSLNEYARKHYEVKKWGN